MRHEAIPGPSRLQAATALARDPLRVYLWLYSRYGDVSRTPISARHAIYVLCRPEHAEHVLVTNQDNYVKAFTYRPLRALVGDGLLTSEGARWRQHRRLIQPMFSRRDVAGFGPAMTEAAQQMLGRWDTHPDGTELNVAAEMSALTLDIVGRAVFDVDLNPAALMMGRAMAAGQRIAVLSSLLPLPWGPRTTAVVRAAARWAGRTEEGIEGLTSRLIAERRTGTGAGGQDLVSRLITARTAAGDPLTDDEIAAEAATFILAGHETTANTLSWTLGLLSAYPSARERLEAEVDQVLDGRPPTVADLAKLPWTAAVVSESLRLYPPAWVIERDALADDEIAGTKVPAGGTVAVPPYLIHRHPEFWRDPAGFDPGRFLGNGTPGNGTPGNGTAAHRYAYLPFGGGRRACIGQAFAEQEAVLVLASIAQRFRLELPPAGLPRPIAAVTLRPGRDMRMRLRRRAAPP